MCCLFINAFVCIIGAEFIDTCCAVVEHWLRKHLWAVNIYWWFFAMH